jgi:hydroxyquinol 1,2-dioxygenase
MRNLTQANLTEAVISAMADTKNSRTKEILISLIRHLHTFIQEVHLTEDEWLAGIQFLTAVGQRCDDKRQEFILLSDTLGATTMKDFINNRRPEGTTEYTILGPFYRMGAPDMPHDASIAEGIAGDPVIVAGHVRAPDGKPIKDALLDVWQASGDGFYDVQGHGLPDMGLRGRFRTGEDGSFRFRTIKPSAYPIPFDGPVGDMLKAMERHPYRPAHIHFIVSADGYQSVTTELYSDDDAYLDSDAVFGVRDSLVVPFVLDNSTDETTLPNVHLSFYHVDYDFVLERL